MKSFDTASRQADAGVTNPIPLTFELDNEDELTANPPTAGQLALFLTANREGGVAALQAMFDFLAQVLEDDGLEVLKDRLAEGMEIMVVTEVVTWLIEEWSARPTEASSTSSQSAKTTGKPSTAKRRSTAKKAS